MLLTQLHWLKVPDQIEFKLMVLVYRCLHLMALYYLASENFGSRPMLKPVGRVIIACRSLHPLFKCRQQSFFSHRFPDVEHSATEHHVGAVSDCLLETPEERTFISSVVPFPNHTVTLSFHTL